MACSPALVYAQVPDWETGEFEEVSALKGSSAPPTPAESERSSEPSSEDTEGDVSSLDLDEKLAALDGYLEEIDAPTRRYFYTWLAVQAGLVTVQLAIASTSDDDPTRGSYFIGSGVAAASIGLLLIGKRPGMGAVTRYRAMPSSSTSDKEAKLAMGEEALAGQATADRKGISWLRHLLGIGAAVGSGAAVALIYEHSLKLAAQRVFATFFVSELQILTRPNAAIRNHGRHSGAARGVEFGVAPLLHWHAQGVSINGRF